MSSNRIPASKSSVFRTWDLPEVKKGQIVQAEKLKRRGPRGELIELSQDEIVYHSITAAQLEEISMAAYEEMREQAYQDGFKQGRADGYQAGLKAGDQAVSQQADALKKTVATLMERLAGQDDAIEQALVNLVISVASAVLRRELSIDSHQILDIVHEAVRALPLAASQLTVHLSEQDYQLLHARDDIPEQWQLRIDRTLSPGGCRVTTAQSVVDYTLEDQFQQVVNHLVEKRFAALAARASPSADAGE